MTKIIIIYLIIINLIAFCMCAIDKRRAIRGAWRISERSLICAAILGGSIGLWIGMYVCHHKTRHAKFFVGVPVILLIQVAATIFILKY